MASHFRIFPRRTLRGRRWYWHLKARNGEIIAHGEGYRNIADAEHAISLVQQSGGLPIRTQYER